MKRIIIFVLIIFSMCSPPDIKVEKIETINLPDSIQLINPQFTPQENQILLTAPGYKGLWLYNLETKKLKKLNDHMGAGYQTKFSEDGKKIAFRYDRYTNRLRKSFLAVQSIESKKINTIIKNQRNLSAPFIFKDNKILYLSEGEPFIYDLATDQITTYQKTENKKLGPLLYSNEGQLILLNKRDKKIINSTDEGHYIWSSISPGGEKLLYTVTGQGTFITDIQGKIQHKIKNATAPKWSPTGDWLLYTKQQDDGHKITASDIYIISPDGEYTFQITDTENKIEMHPNWSPSGKKIVYETGNNKIEIIHLSI